MKDERWMRRALALAERGGRETWPNPRVGCVLVKGGEVVGEGWHKKAGGPHAEPQALLKAGARAKGATAYVTLEPCVSHAGKRTPPCADALVRAGIRKVVLAMKDPNPAVTGRGIAFLKRHKVAVEAGLLREEAEEMNGPFILRMREKRPWVILKSALSLDGKAHARGGASRWVTGPEAREAVHKLRAEVDAILVGSGTALADDPLLSARGEGPDPLPVVLDTRGRLPKTAKLFGGAHRPLIFTASGKAGTIKTPRGPGGLKLRAVLAELSRRGVGTLLVEGGPTVHASFLEQGFVDEACIFIAPKLLSGARDPNAAPRLPFPRLRQVGSDFLFYGRVRF